MRFANLRGRAVLEVDGLVVDLERASGGRFSSDLPAAFDRWDELTAWVDAVGANVGGGEPYDPAELGSPSPTPRQVFAAGLNYRSHAVEVGVGEPDQPLVFGKFPTCITGPRSEVAVPGDDSMVDWEVELAVVVGRTARQVGADEAWDHVAGLTVGQDMSERRLQFAGTAPQFGLAKSYSGFGPLGPVLVTPDELDDPDDLALGCSLNGEKVQGARTSELIFPVAELVAFLSSVVTLLPGDVIFTGSPEGVGLTQDPPRFLRDGDELVSYVEGIGELRQRIVGQRRGRRSPSYGAGGGAVDDRM